MGQTTQQIEADIQETRDSLGSNLDELENRARSAADWKQRFRAKPVKYLGLALGGGLVLAALFGGRKGRNVSSGAFYDNYERPVRPREPLAEARSENVATSKLWDGVKVAVVGAATTRLMRYLKTEHPISDGGSGKTNGATTW